MEEDGYKHERKITFIEENYLHRTYRLFVQTKIPL